MKQDKKSLSYGSIFLSVLMALSFWVNTGCSPAKKSEAIKAKEISLGQLHPGLIKETMQVSPGLNHLAYAAKSGEKYIMVIDGQESQEYDGIHLPDSIFSSDEKTTVYGAWRNDKIMAVINGQESEPYARLRLIRFSPDGQRLAYWVATGEKETDLKANLIVDRKEGPVYRWFGESSPGPFGNDVTKYRPVFSPDSHRLAYVALIGQQELIVVDGKESDKYDEIVSAPIFSPDSKRVAYISRKDGQYRTVVDGQPGQEYERIENLMFSPDSQKFAYIACRHDNQLVVVDGTEQPEFRMIDRLMFSPDGKHLAYVADEGQNQVLVLDGQKSTPFDLVDHLVFSPDSQHLAYSVLSDQKTLLYVDGQEKPSYRFVVSIDFSPDSQKIIYTGREGLDQMDLLINGEKAKSYEEISSWVFSPDGKRMAYWAKRDGKNFIVVDDLEGQAYDYPSYLYQDKYQPVFSPDGRHLGYVALKGNQNLVVIDGKESRLYDEILTPLVFDGPVNYHFLAIDKNQVFRVEGKL
ncbi:MAG: hypothetical protein PHU81_06395 [Acidobacteriota bacterium]|nr:hypothetical protein [Acidobacteriota bacterium]